MRVELCRHTCSYRQTDIKRAIQVGLSGCIPGIVCHISIGQLQFRPRYIMEYSQIPTVYSADHKTGTWDMLMGESLRFK